MTDDDPTLDADDDMLDELRRLAAEAKASVGAMPTDTDATIDADDGTMEELRRFAEEARASVTTGTFDAPPVGGCASDRLGEGDDAVVAAPSKESDTIPLRVIPDLDPPPEQLTRSRPPAALPDVESPAAPATRPTPAFESESTQRRGMRSDSMQAPSSIEQGSGWRPPPRMVMPSEPEKRQPSAQAGPWKLVAIGLGVAMVVLIAVLALGIVGGDDSPVDDDVPTTDLIDGPQEGDGADG